MTWERKGIPFYKVRETLLCQEKPSVAYLSSATAGLTSISLYENKHFYELLIINS